MFPEFVSDPLSPQLRFRLLRWSRLYLSAWLDLLFPPRCAGCGTVGTDLCDICRSRFRPVSAPYCRRCGQPLVSGSLCAPCARGKFTHLDLARAAAVYTSPLRDVLHEFKYRGNTRLAQPLGDYMARRVRKEVLQVDALVPVPLHRTRLQQRGYNQAALLARTLGGILHVPVRPEWLSRVRATPPQVTLSLRERLENMRGAFQCETASAVRGKSVLVIDDVMTTGSTLEACAAALKEAGAARVWGYTLARAVFDG